MSWSSAPFVRGAAARLALLIPALLLGSGCVSSRSFVPAEHVTAFSPDGVEYAAEYSIDEAGNELADVKVWSAGASRDGSDTDPHTTIRVGFELINHADEPLRLDAKRLYLEEMPTDGAPRGRLGPASVTGELLVPSGESRQVDAVFALPNGVWPSDVPGYRVAWSVLGRQPHSRKTPFLRALEARPVDPGYPYYGYYYPGFYPGFYGSAYSGYRGWPPPYRERRIRVR